MAGGNAPTEMIGGKVATAEGGDDGLLFGAGAGQERLAQTEQREGWRQLSLELAAAAAETVEVAVDTKIAANTETADTEAADTKAAAGTEVAVDTDAVDTEVVSDTEAAEVAETVELAMEETMAKVAEVAAAAAAAAAAAPELVAGEAPKATLQDNGGGGGDATEATGGGERSGQRRGRHARGRPNGLIRWWKRWSSQWVGGEERRKGLTTLES